MEIKKPQHNKYDIDMEKLKNGWIQKVIGSGDNAAYALSFIILVFLCIGLVCAIIWGDQDQQRNVIGLLSPCIAYLFGRNSGKKD